MLPLAEQFFVVEQIMHSLRTEQIDKYLQKEIISEEILVLPDWQKKILQQRLEDVKNGDVIADEEAHKIIEQCFV